MHFARSRTIWLLLSLGAAFAVLAWSTERGPQAAPTAGRLTGARLVPVAAGRGFFGRVPRGVKVVSGVDTFTGRGAETTCTTYTWGGAMHPTVTVTPCVAGRVQLRRLP